MVGPAPACRRRATPDAVLQPGRDEETLGRKAPDDAEPTQVHDVLVDVREVADHDGAARAEDAADLVERSRAVGGLAEVVLP
jgi:hypothetical protein